VHLVNKGKQTRFRTTQRDIHTPTPLHTHTPTHTRLRAHTHARTHAHTRTHTHTHLHTHTLTHTHLYTNTHAAFRRACWFSWPRQVESVRALASDARADFRAVLPGHGRPLICQDGAEMQAREGEGDGGWEGGCKGVEPCHAQGIRPPASHRANSFAWCCITVTMTAYEFQ
jgi:hypothetical protein